MKFIYAVFRNRCHNLQKSLVCINCSKFHYTSNQRQDFKQSDYEFQKKNDYNKYTIGIFSGLSIGMAAIYLYKYQKKAFMESKQKPHAEFGLVKPNLPFYNMEQVAKHNNSKNRIWVTYGQGIYDITDFVKEHPGGDKILLAAGASVEPFWLMYAVHQKPDILAMLEKYRIGNISEEEAKEATRNMEDPYAGEPRRHPILRPSAERPFNAEPPPSLLVDSFITPTDLFYVRNHLPVPTIDPKTYELEISGEGVRSAKLTLDDLKKFPKHTIIATIQCAGNRRSEMSLIKKVKGLDWGHAAIGNATFTGVRLYDVLTHLGLKESTEAKHIQFEGIDTDPTNTPYGASIPIEKGMDPRGDVLLAFEMNGEPLTRDHGFPVRVIVPGIVGARNVKWLGSITVSREESSSHWQQNDYKGFSPSTDWDTVDFKTAPAIQELPVISAVGEPENNSCVCPVNGKILVKGYAFSGGGHKIVRVDLTQDGGKTWQVANITHQDKANTPRHWGWTLWQTELHVSPKASKVELWVKAVDSSYNTQPESFQNIWNLRGVLSNAYHRVTINVKH